MHTLSGTSYASRSRVLKSLYHTASQISGKAIKRGTVLAFLLAATICQASLSAQTLIATGNNSAVNGYLAIDTDAFGSWAALGGSPSDVYVSHGLGQGQPGFTNGFYLLVASRAQRELLTANTNWRGFWSGYIANDTSLNTSILLANSASDTNNDGVMDTLTSAFRVYSPNLSTDLHFDLVQRIHNFGASAGRIQQVYTIRNDGSGPIGFKMVRNYDGDLLWSGDYLDDEVGTTANAFPLGASVFMQEASSPGTTRVRISSLSSQATGYYATKVGIDPPGGTAPTGGTSARIWDDFGLPQGWAGFIPNIGTGIDGVSGPQPTSNGDAAIGLEFTISLSPGQSKTLPIDFTYGEPKAERISYVTTPSTIVGQGLNWPTFSVRLEDNDGNLIETATDSITVSLAQGNGTLSGTLTRQAIQGIATFTDLNYDLAESTAINLTGSGLSGINNTQIIVREVRPDLRITGSGITSDPIAPAVGVTTTLSARVVNVGTETSTASVQFYQGNPNFGGTTLGSPVQVSVPVGGEASAARNWTPVVEGSFSIFAVVDNLSFTETTIEDNRASRQINVGAAPIVLQVVAGQTIAWPGASAAIAVQINNVGTGPATITGTSFGPPSWLTATASLVGTTILPGESIVSLLNLVVPNNAAGAPLGGEPLTQLIPIQVDSGSSSGPISFVGKLAVKMYDQAASVATIRVEDSTTGQAISGALVTAQDLSDSFVTDGLGRVTMSLAPGVRGVFAFKTGFIATSITLVIPEGVSNHTIQIDQGETLAVKQIVSEPLTSTEIAERGITLNDPINNEVVDFTVAMQVGPPLVLQNIEVPITPSPGETYVVSGTAYTPTTQTTGTPTQANSLLGGGALLSGVFEYHADGHTETWIIIPGQISILKQMFDATTFVVNAANPANPSDVQLTNVIATLTVPNGIGLPDLDGSPQTLTKNLGTLDAGEAAQAVWTIRGDLPGSYRLTGDVSANLVAFGQTAVTLSSTALSNPFEVTVPRIRCEFVTPAIVTKDVPFDFGVLITNESLSPANVVRVTLRQEDLLHCAIATNQSQASVTTDLGGAILTVEVSLGDIASGQSKYALFQLVPDVTGTIVALRTVSGCGGNPTPPVEVVPAAPIITTQPNDQTECAGNTASFTVIASGPPPMTYQWRKDGVDVTGATQAVYAIASLTAASAGAYDVVVSNQGGFTTSQPASLTVLLPPTITSEPSSIATTEGTEATLTISASGTGTLTYQWRKNGIDILGANNTSLAFVPTTYGDQANYDCAVSNNCGTTLSATAVLSVNRLPVINCNTPVALWSPKHDLVDISSSFSVADPDGDTLSIGYQVYSNETEVPETGDGTGRHAPDFITELGGRGLLVRSERRSKADGRWYIIIVTVNDSKGGTTTKACIAGVCPHDQTQASFDTAMAKASLALSSIQGSLDAGNSVSTAFVEHGNAAALGPKQ